MTGILSLVIFSNILCLHLTYGQIIANGAFFQTYYKCHCLSGCYQDGTCVDKGKCADEWFGLKCQYQDLATSNELINQLDNMLTDRNDNSCLQTQTDTLTISWRTSFVFTWLRIVVKNATMLSNFDVQFRSNSASQTILRCDNRIVYLVNPTTLDIQCEVKETITILTITGAAVKSLCSLYINGGRNVALKQNTWQSTNHTEYNTLFTSDKAVDGNTNSNFLNFSCSHTAPGDPAPRWNISLVSVQQITKYVLFNRDDNRERLTGFSLQAEGPQGQSFAFNDSTTTPSPNYTVLDPSKHGISQVSITSKAGKILTLCEVEIYGDCLSGWDLNCINCQGSCATTCHKDTGQCNVVCFGFSNPPLCTTACADGKFGLNCTEKCPTNCIRCNLLTGLCINCIAGLQGGQCTNACSSLSWGQDCNKTCSPNCVNTQCNNVHGACNGGCKDGFQLPNCDTICDSAHWGINCSNACSPHCQTTTCNNVNGTCNGGCKAGYKPPQCITVCDNTHWGVNCINTCSSNCQSVTCNNVNGSCDGGCKAGYEPPQCTTVCRDGKWGINCGSICGSCTSQPCNKTNGECPSGCQDGYKAPLCIDKCDETKYGPNCSLNCSNNCTDQTCHHITGQCNSCIPGYQGDFCNQTCNSTTYGQNCSLNCSVNCTNHLCQPMTGYCYECHPGFIGDLCTQSCPNGKYGPNCSQTCSLNCNKSKDCDPIDGRCYVGCQDGYIGDLCIEKCSSGNYGAKCNSTCSTSCQSKTCNHASGECLIGCLENYYGRFCETYEEPTNVGAIVGGIIAILVVALITAAGAIFWKRRYHKKSDSIKSEELNLKPSDFSKPNDFEDGESPYSNISETVTDTKISVDTLKDFFQTHNTQVLAEQYQNVPKPKNVTTEVGFIEENKAKNRYKNICPYDHSRVHLKINSGKNEGDYINASYVRDNHDGVKFIAAQGPFEAVVNDFVRMLWEQKVEKVVMLTNLIEEGKVKCDKYWPDSDKTTFGEIEVKLKETETFADYTIRTIELEKVGEKTRTLTHYHFTSWPDQGVPLTPWALVDFEQRVHVNDSTATVVVHCSAGVGRTGTFIALHNVIQQAHETGYVDFYNTLVKLREDRFLMIQTPDQYIFLHKAAQAAIVAMGTTVTSMDMRTRLRHLQEKTDSGISNMEKEFNNLCDICQEENKAIKEADPVYQNADSLKIDLKNRFPSIIPKNSYRPFLACENKDMDNYINAVFLQGFQKKDQHILTQLPMPSTVTDFWRMVTQYKVSLVVAFEVDSIKTDQTIANYLPTENKSITSSNFEIQCTSRRDDDLWEELDLQVLTSNSKATQHNLIHLKCKVTDIDAKTLLTFVNKARSFNAQANGRIVYTCRNGAAYSGLACVLSLLLDRIEHDTCLAVPLVVGSIKSIRPQVIPTFKQYYMLHEALQRYNETTGTYSNMDELFLPNFSKGRTSIVQPSDESQYGNGNIYSNV